MMKIVHKIPNICPRSLGSETMIFKGYAVFDVLELEKNLLKK